MVHAAEPTNTPAPTQPLVPAVVPAAGAEIAPLTAALAVNPNLERARAAPIPSRPTVLAALTGRLARASAKANVAAHPDTAETMRASAELAARLSSEPVNLLPRTSRLMAPAAPMARHVLDSAKAAAVALRGTVEPVATFAVPVVSRASEPVTTAPRMFRQTGSVAKMGKRARGLLKVNVAALLGTAGLGAISAAPAASQASVLATPTLEASLQTASAARTAKHAKDTPRASVAALPASAGLGAISAAPVARQPSGLVTVVPELSQPTANVARTARPVKGSCYRSSDRHEVQRARDGHASWRSQLTYGPLLARSLRTSCEAQAPRLLRSSNQFCP
jgi:hypothetical protein